MTFRRNQFVGKAVLLAAVLLMSALIDSHSRFPGGGLEFNVGFLIAVFVGVPLVAAVLGGALFGVTYIVTEKTTADHGRLCILMGIYVTVLWYVYWFWNGTAAKWLPIYILAFMYALPRIGLNSKPHLQRGPNEGKQDVKPRTRTTSASEYLQSDHWAEQYADATVGILTVAGVFLIVFVVDRASNDATPITTLYLVTLAITFPVLLPFGLMHLAERLSSREGQIQFSRQRAEGKRRGDWNSEAAGMIDRGAWNALIELGDAWIIAEREHFGGWYAVALGHQARGNLSDAINEFTIALRLAEKSDRVLAAKIKVFLDDTQRRFDEQRRSARAVELESAAAWPELRTLAMEWIDSGSASYTAWYALGKAHEGLRKYDEAAQAYGTAMTLVQAHEAQTLANLSARISEVRAKQAKAKQQNSKEQHSSSSRRQYGSPDREKTIDDHYNVLGVRSTASDSEITSAFRKRMQEYHPDRVAGLGVELRDLATEKAKDINAAYKAIRDARRSASTQ